MLLVNQILTRLSSCGLLYSPTKESDMNDWMQELLDLPDALLDGLFDDEPAEVVE